MQPEHCPFHRCADTCVPMARLLAQAGLLDPTPHAPVAVGMCEEGTSIPPRQVTLVRVAELLNHWGRVVIDPSLPRAEVGVLEERSLRYSLQALWEAVSDGTRRQFASMQAATAQWWKVGNALHEAQGAAHRTTTGGDPAEADLWWHIALLHLERARTLWKDRIGSSLPH
ncbi:hypothetical protein ACWGCW_12820 [Streptomyces sp. NPDC054933]